MSDAGVAPVMRAHLFPFFLFAALAVSPVPSQEPSRLDGAWRGPLDESLITADLERFELSPLGGLVGHGVGWEFWFEQERDLLLRGEPDFPPRAVGENGRYGRDGWAVSRSEVLLESLPLLVESLESDDPAVREAAVISLGRISYPASEGLVRGLADDPDPAVRQAVRLAMGMLATDEAVAWLSEEVGDATTPEAERSLAALGLGLSGRVRAGTALKLALTEAFSDDAWREHPGFVQACVLAAAVHGSADFVRILRRWNTVLAELHDADAIALRAEVLRALGALGDERAAPDLLTALGAEDRIVEVAAVQALARLGDTDTVPHLVRFLDGTRDPELRASTLLALGRIGGRQAEQALSALRPPRSADLGERTAWHLACGLARVPDAWEPMRDTMLHGSRTHAAEDAEPTRDEEVLRGAAAIGLGLFGNPEAMAPLRRALEQESASPAFRANLLQAVGLLGVPDAESLLTKMRPEGLRPEERRGLAFGLAALGGDLAATRLTDLVLGDEDARVRWAAARGLASCRSDRALERLVFALRHDLGQEAVPARTSHVLLALGRLGDVHSGSLIGSLVAGGDPAADDPLLAVLRAY